MNRKILLIERDENRCFHFAKAINRTGASCDGMRDGLIAVARYAQNLLDGNPYDLVLMDANLPGSDSVIATQCIRSLEQEWWRLHYPRVPILGFSDLADFGSIDGLRIGMDSVHPKPISASDLLTVLLQHPRGDASPIAFNNS